MSGPPLPLRRVVAIILGSALFCAAAWAADTFYWDPDRVQRESTLFTEVSGLQSGAVDRAEQEMMAVDGALASAQLSINFAKGYATTKAVTGAETFFEQQSVAFESSAQALQAEVDSWGQMTRQAFLDAVSRALFAEADARGVKKIEQCSPPAPGGIGLPGRAPAASSCPGTDVSDSVRKRIDSDADLKAAVDEIKKAAPALKTLKLPEDKQAPIGGPSAWVDPVRLLNEVHALGETLVLLEQFRDDVITEAEMELKEKTFDISDPEARSAAVQEVQAVMDRRLAEVDALVQSVGGVVRKRLKDEKETGVCAFAQSGWGGCTGQDRTEIVIGSLNKDRGLAKALERALPDSAP